MSGNLFYRHGVGVGRSEAVREAYEWYLVCVVGGLFAFALNRSLAYLFIVCSSVIKPWATCGFLC